MTYPAYAFVWYRVRAGHEQAAAAAVTIAYAELPSERRPRLFVRRDDRGETWMEMHTADTLLPTVPCALSACIDGERHVERFDEIVS